MKKKPLVIVPVIILAATVGLFVYFQNKNNHDPNLIYLSGNIEVIETELSFMVVGRVEKRMVSEGEKVTAGQVVAKLENIEYAQEVALRQAEIQAAQAVLAELLAGSRPEELAQSQAAVQRVQAKLTELLNGPRPQEIAVAKAAVERARAEADRLQKDFERQSQLYEQKIIPAKEFEAAQTAHIVALARLREVEEQLKLIKEGVRQEQIEQARHSLREAKERLALVKAGPRQETIDQAKAKLNLAQGSLALAETRLGYTILNSPISGLVLSTAIEPGERVAPGTAIMTVADLEKVWLRAFISESDLGRIKIGQQVKVTTDTYPEKVYEGKISFLSSEAEFTPKNVQTEKERVKMVYRLKIDIPNPQMELKPGMPADAVILI